jgi:AP2-like factor (euAP2 lineage)
MTANIQLTNIGLSTIVDERHVQHLIEMCDWSFIPAKNVVRSVREVKNSPTISLPVYILKLENRYERGMYVKHINNNSLDNRSSNLTLIRRGKATRLKTSQYIGVSKVRNSKLWRAQIKHENKTRYLGSFSEEEQAAVAYNTALKLIPIPEKCKNYNTTN